MKDLELKLRDLTPAAEQDQWCYAGLLPPELLWFTVAQAAEALGCSQQYVRDCLDTGELLGHEMTGRSRGGTGQRRKVVIRREALLLYLSETATYDAALLEERLQQFLKELPLPYLKKVQEFTAAVLEVREQEREQQRNRRRWGPRA